MNKLPAKLRKHNYGVLSDKALAMVDVHTNKRSVIPHENLFTEVGQVANFCVKHNCENVWIAPYTEISQKFLNKDFIMESAKYEYNVGTEENATDASYLYIYRKSGTYQEKGLTCFTIPESNNSSFDIPLDFKPSQLFQALTRLTYLSPVDIKCSPTYIGKRVIEYTLEIKEGRMNWLAPCTFVPSYEMAIGDIVWMNENILRRKKFLHAYDRNSAYTASCCGQMFGEGTPILQEKPTFDKHKIGVWNISYDVCNSEYTGNILPLPFDEMRKEWVWTPTLQSMIDLGYHVDIQQAYLWDKSHAILNDYGSTIWNMKQELKEPVEEKYELGQYVASVWSKAIAVNTIGGFLSAYENRITPLYRIDFNFLVKSSNRQRVLITVEKYRQEGFYPVMIYNDAIYYLSDDKNPHTAISDITKSQGSHGGYKHKGTVLWSDIEGIYNTHDIIGTLHYFNQHAV